MPPAPRPNPALFILYVAVVLTVVMGLFPPFTSLGGIEYAFALTGPEWARAMGDVGADVGLGARLHWPLLLVQLAAVWAIALGARRWLVPPQATQQHRVALPIPSFIYPTRSSCIAAKCSPSCSP